MKRTSASFSPDPGTLERFYGVNARFASRVASLLGKRVRQGAGRRLRNFERSLKGLFTDDGICDRCMPSIDALTCASRNSHGYQADDRFQRLVASELVTRQGKCMPMIGTGADVMNGATVRVADLLDELVLSAPKDFSPVRSRQRDKAIALIRDEALLDEAAYSFNNVGLERMTDGGRLRVGDETLPVPAQLPDSGELTALGCGACTLGPRLETKVRELFGEKRAALALALDYLGNELLQSLSRRLLDQILTSVRQHGLSLGQELHVGDPDLDISTQAATLRLAGAGGIGISLHRNNLLLPTKSTSLVFAIGRDLPRVPWTPCERCPTRKRCNARGR